MLYLLNINLCKFYWSFPTILEGSVYIQKMLFAETEFVLHIQDLQCKHILLYSVTEAETVDSVA